MKTIKNILNLVGLVALVALLASAFLLIWVDVSETWFYPSGGVVVFVSLLLGFIQSREAKDQERQRVQILETENVTLKSKLRELEEEHP